MLDTAARTDGEGVTAPALTLEVRRAYRAAAREELAIRSLAFFVRAAWRIVEPSTRLVWGAHIDIICAALEDVTRGETQELVICIPPGHMKSLLVGVFWPAWQWLHRPGEKTMHLSNDEALAIRDARKTREILSSAWYGRCVVRQAIRTGDAVIDGASGEIVWTVRGAARCNAQGASVRAGAPYVPWTFADDQNTKANYENTPHHGARVCLSMWGKVTGKRCHGAVIDDPYDVKEVLFGGEGATVEKMQRAVEVYDGAIKSRLNRPKYRVVVMQRLHEADLAGVLIRRGVRHVVLPAVGDPTHPDRHPADTRAAGEMLCPAVHSAVEDAALRTSNGGLGERAYAAQYGQRPQAATGGTFRVEWWREYDGDPQRLEAHLGGFDEIAVSVDCTFRKTVTSDFVHLAVWAKKGLDRYLLDEVRGRMELPETAKALILLAKKWPRARLKLIETKANGDALVQLLRALLPGLVGYDPAASKEARAQMAALVFEAGHVYLPNARWCPWITDFKSELAGFPAAAHDDRVDTTSQILIRWGDGSALDNPLERLNREIAGWMN